MKMDRATIESNGVAERLQQLSVAPKEVSTRSETPPPRQQAQQGRHHHSSPSFTDLSPSRKENSSPIMSIQKQVRPYDLTPVTRNTGTAFVDDDRRHVISPDDAHQKKGLSLPSSANMGTGSRPPLMRREAPVLNPIPLGDRSRSLGQVSELEQADDDEYDELDDNETFGEAIQFPERQRFYSFNSRHQYIEQIPMVSNVPMSKTPYQPSRHDLSDVGSLSTEELSRIFIHKDMNPILMEERQYSIPSIRMANHLNGSTTTYDDDDEDDLSKDDASWSSRGSSLYLPDDDDVCVTQVLKFTPTTPAKPVVILEDLPFPEELTQSEHCSVDAVASNQDNFNNDNHNNHKKRKESHKKAFEWLRTVEGTGDNCICEAASSKFLTRGGRNGLTRQMSSPPEV